MIYHLKSGQFGYSDNYKFPLDVRHVVQPLPHLIKMILKYIFVCRNEGEVIVFLLIIENMCNQHYNILKIIKASYNF